MKKIIIAPASVVAAGVTALLFQPLSSAAPTTETKMTDVSVNVRKVASPAPSTDQDQAPLTNSPTPDEDNSESASEPADAKESRAVLTSKKADVRENKSPLKRNLDKFKVEKKQEVVTTAPTTVSQPVTSSLPQIPATYNANTGNAIVDAALSQVGKPYVFGATGPSAFDCSGLTSWAYAQAGKSIPRTSQAQWSAGQSVPVDQMQPGDIIVSYGGGHVGIYLGDGQMVHAPTTGDVVKVSPLQPVDGVVRF